jgi:hypothetical protein
MTITSTTLVPAVTTKVPDEVKLCEVYPPGDGADGVDVANASAPPPSDPPVQSVTLELAKNFSILGMAQAVIWLT